MCLECEVLHINSKKTEKLNKKVIQTKISTVQLCFGVDQSFQRCFKDFHEMYRPESRLKQDKSALTFTEIEQISAEIL